MTPVPTDDLRVDIGAIIVHTLVFGSNTSADSKPILTTKKNNVIESETVYKSNEKEIPVAPSKPPMAKSFPFKTATPIEKSNHQWLVMLRDMN